MEYRQLVSAEELSRHIQTPHYEPLYRVAKDLQAMREKEELVDCPQCAGTTIIVDDGDGGKSWPCQICVDGKITAERYRLGKMLVHAADESKNVDVRVALTCAAIDVWRGRSLTEVEQLNNLARELGTTPERLKEGLRTREERLQQIAAEPVRGAP